MDGFKGLGLLAVRLVISHQVKACQGQIAVVEHSQQHIVIAAGIGQGVRQHVSDQLQPRHQLEGKPIQFFAIYIISVYEIIALLFADDLDIIRRAFILVGFDGGEHEGLADRVSRVVIPYRANFEQVGLAILRLSRCFQPPEAFPAVQPCPMQIGPGHIHIVIPDVPIIIPILRIFLCDLAAHQAIVHSILRLLEEEDKRL